jgi:hypothetical protein
LVYDHVLNRFHAVMTTATATEERDMAKASKLAIGDEFRIEVPVEVVEIFEDGGRTKVRAKLLDTHSLKFTEGSTIAFWCPRSREFTCARRALEEAMQQPTEPIHLH